jgi:hypothetical protein
VLATDGRVTLAYNADSAISSFVMDDHGSLAFLESFQGGPRDPASARGGPPP